MDDKSEITGWKKKDVGEGGGGGRRRGGGRRGSCAGVEGIIAFSRLNSCY